MLQYRYRTPQLASGVLMARRQADETTHFNVRKEMEEIGTFVVQY